MIHIRDFVVFLASDPRFGLRRQARTARARERRRRDRHDMPLSAAAILRPVLYAPPSMPALDLLLKMQTSRTHMALVIDEYGGTDGLVSIEDVVESIVGDIEDEHDEAETPRIAAGRRRIHRRGARAARRSVRGGRLRFLRACRRGGRRHDRRPCHRPAGRVPGRGEILPGRGEFEFEVLDADPRRIKRLKMPAARRAGRASRDAAAGLTSAEAR